LLLVEDHVPTVRALVQLLARRGFDVTFATSIEEALTTAAGKTVDVVISDIGLPDGSGYDLMLELRRRYGLTGIAMTGYGMEADVSRSQQSGFATHLTKPVSLQALETALAKINLAKQPNPHSA
jgi:CheY-like chemotaxis protein